MSLPPYRRLCVRSRAGHGHCVLGWAVGLRRGSRSRSRSPQRGGMVIIILMDILMGLGHLQVYRVVRRRL
jgi:hypothetical protein